MKKVKIKNNVRYFRNKLGMTQEELAENVGVHRQTILSIERQKYEPKIGIVLSLASTFDEPVESIFFIEQE